MRQHVGEVISLGLVCREFLAIMVLLFISNYFYYKIIYLFNVIHSYSSKFKGLKDKGKTSLLDPCLEGTDVTSLSCNL